MSGHRPNVRPRCGRIAAFAVSASVTAVAALAGLGVLASSPSPAGAAVQPRASYRPSAGSGLGAAEGGGQQEPARSSTGQSSTGQESAPGVDSAQDSSHPDPAAQSALPADSGTGRRIVFSQSEQRVWLMGRSADGLQRTYLVSGSVVDNLQPGTYSVYSKSRWAVGVDHSGAMQYFVRFTRGPTGAAIGFHTIPTRNGVPQETKAELGTPQSHGCIRQALPDAIALWNFSGIGTKVVVVA